MYKLKEDTDKIVKANESYYDLIVLGGGVAGVTAACSAIKLGLKTILIERSVIGSNVYNIPVIEDFSFASNGKKKSGTELAKDLNLYLHSSEVNCVFEEILDIENSVDKIKKIITNKHTYHGRAIIIATGLCYVPYNVNEEQKFIGRGIHYTQPCGQDDKKFHNIAIVGHDERCLVIASYLSKYSKQVYLITPKTNLNADGTLVHKIYSNKKIKLLLNHNIEELIGSPILETIKVHNISKNKYAYIGIEDLFILIEQQANLDFINLDSCPLKVDDDLTIYTNEKMETNLPGIYAAGDVRKYKYNRAVTSAADGLIAVRSAMNYLYFQS